MSRQLPILAAGLLLGGACRSVPPPPADLLEVIDLSGRVTPHGKDVALELLAQGDASWERRADPAELVAARISYWSAAVADPSLYDAYWKAARACQRIGLITEPKPARAAEFQRGLGIAQLGLALAPERAEARYYYANSLGLLARERHSIGLDSVRMMVPQLERAAEIDPDLDGAGPLRTLALLYLRAPAWPTSVGDEELGLEYAERAVQRAPEHPGNQLALAEARMANGDRDGAHAALKRGVELLVETTADPERDALMEEARRLREKLR